jgi:hypothetical protein
MSTATTTSHNTGQTTSRRSTTQPTTQTSPNAAQRLRTTMAAVRLSFTWLGVRKTLAPEQRTTAARAFHADRELLSARRHQLDRRRDQIVLQARVALGRAAGSGSPERRASGRHCGRQDRRATPVGLRTMPGGRLGGGVFAVGRRWRESSKGGACRLRPP